jgi:hypothetical protein
VIPSDRDIVAGAAFLAERYALEVPPPAVLKLARAEAVALAVDEADEPAALFYAFSRRARGLRSAWSVLPDLLALNQATALGHELVTERDALRSLRVAIATQTATFEEVRARFRSWTRAGGDPAR